MAAENLGAILTVPGRLAINPTDLTTAYPHGGTALGLAREIAVVPQQTTIEIRAEEFGQEVMDLLDAGRAWRLAAALRGFDGDAVAAIFPATAAGGSSGATTITEPGNARAGRLVSGSSVALVFSPDDTARHIGVLFHRALPLLDEAAELTLQLSEEATIGVVFQAIRAANGRSVSIGLLEDLQPLL